MSLYYLPTINKYLGKYDVFEPPEVVEGDRAEKIWKESLPNYSLRELVEIFPEIKEDKEFKQELKNKIKACQKLVDTGRKNELICQNKMAKVKFKDREWTYEWFKLLYIDPFLDLEPELKHLEALSTEISGFEEILPEGNITDQDIRRAKEYPMHNLINFNRSGFAHCIWHVEKNPSMHYYKEKNLVKCFSCGAHGDTIEVIRQLHNLDFISAVKFIIK